MKLIDSLVKELPKRGGWPEGAVEAEVFRYEGGLVNFWTEEGEPFNGGVNNFRLEGLDLFEVESVMRAQYEAALAASEGWIEWGGGECPVKNESIISVKHRDGLIYDREHPLTGAAEIWTHSNHPGDIIAYRLHKTDINYRANDNRLEQDLNECIGQPVQWHGDGVPPVGIECEVKWTGGKWEKCEVLFVGTEKVVFEMRNGEAAMSLCDVKFRPLRTEAEKLREKLAASLHIAAGASPIELNGIGPLYFELADAIISGSVFGTTFKADK